MLDEGNFRDMGSGPEKQWISFGIVQPDPSGSDHSVRFNDENGQPLPHGALVDVKLEPSGTIVPCRMIMRTAGAGEGEWDPIGPGDEVAVAIPGGDERAGCVILGRLSNSLDKFPAAVAGQDVTNNSIVMRRYRSPFVLESGTAVQLRNAKTGAQLTMDPAGSVFLGSGDKHVLAMTADVVSLALGSQDASFQLVADKKQATIQALGTSFLFDDVDSVFQTGGTLTFNTAGGGGGGHAVTLEQVVALFANYTVMLGVGLLAAVPPVSLNATLLSSPSTLDAFLAALVLGAGLPLAPCAPPATPGGNFAAFPLTFGPTGAVGAGMAASWPLAGLDQSGFVPGLGRPGFLL